MDLIHKLTNANIKQNGQRILPTPSAPPKSFDNVPSELIFGKIVGMRQIKSPNTIVKADMSFRLVGIFFRKANLM